MTPTEIKIDIDEVIKDASKRIDRSQWRKMAIASIYSMGENHHVALYGPRCGDRIATNCYKSKAEAIYAAIDWADRRMIRIDAWL